MSRVKGQLTTADYLPIEDFNRLVDGLHNDGNFIWELYCRLSFCTALRVSDVLDITWKEVLGKEEFCRVEGKTGKIRRIRLNNSVRDKISELYILLGSPDRNAPMISNKETGKAYSIEHINRTLKTFKFKYRLPITSFSSHTFRKTFGRFVYESQNKSAESLVLLNTIFKHSSLEITKVYIGIRQNEIDNIYDSIKF